MKLIPQKKFFRFISLLFVTTLMLLPSLYCGVAIPARAEASPEVPEASTDFYYNDQANLLSEETRSLILTKTPLLPPILSSWWSSPWIPFPSPAILSGWSTCAL